MSIEIIPTGAPLGAEIRGVDWGGALGIPRLWRGSLGRGKLPIRCPMIGIAVFD